jgi:lipid A 3-O-deacylase
MPPPHLLGPSFDLSEAAYEGSFPLIMFGRPCVRVAILVAGILSSGSVRAEDEPERPLDNRGVFSFQLENDLVQHTDRHYTNGIRFSYLTPEGGVPDSVQNGADLVPLFSVDGRKRASFVLGQSMFTPSNIRLRDPPTNDRPYAGWLYGGIGLVSDTGKRLDNLELDIGIVGPQSYAEDAQKFVHEIIGAKQPQGWDHQLKNEPGIVLTYERTWRAIAQAYPLGFAADLSPHVGGALGNVFTNAAGGLMLRVGHNLPEDYGPPRIRPSLPGSDFFIPTSGFGWYLFAGVEERAVLRNIFLDGNTFAHSASVDKNTWVGDFQFGIAVTLGEVRVALTEVNRTREFEGQQHPDSFGALTVGMRF